MALKIARWEERFMRRLGIPRSVDRMMVDYVEHGIVRKTETRTKQQAARHRQNKVAKQARKRNR